jgi:hypothetical protein
MAVHLAAPFIFLFKSDHLEIPDKWAIVKKIRLIWFSGGRLENLQTNINQPHPITRHISLLAGELNIARRNWNAYPSGHPMVEASIQKLATAWQALYTASPSVRIGITKEGLLVDETYIDKGNAACKMLAATLFERGVGTMQVLTPPSPSELREMLDILAMKREDVLIAGGIEYLWKNAGIRSIALAIIRYDLFSGTEGGRPDTSPGLKKQSIWEQFIKKLMQSAVADTEPSLDPASLASILNKRYAVKPPVKIPDLEGALSLICKRALPFAGHPEQHGSSSDSLIPSIDGQSNLTDREPDSPDHPISAELLIFIRNLDPVLRRQIIDGFCETASDDAELTEQLCRQLGTNLLKETYGTAEEYAEAPEILRGVLETLTTEESKKIKSEESQAEKRNKLKLLLQEHHAELYIPENYLNQLKDLLSSSRPNPLQASEISELLKGIQPQSIENTISEIILQLVISDPNGDDAGELIQNLADLCGSFLETGDYGQVLRVFAQAADPRLPQQTRIAMRDAFCRKEFLEEILSGLSIWGKPKYDDVTTLIHVVGNPFLPPLLDQLADEGNMSLRRFLMDRIQKFGFTARAAIIPRLTDSRWYYVRNLIILLRSIDPQGAIDHLRPLLKNANPKLRNELLKSLLLAGDPVAERQILRELGSEDRELKLAAVYLSDLSKSADIARKLVSIIFDGGYSSLEYEIKSAAVQSLATIGYPDVLPELSRLFHARSLLHTKQLTRLKLDFIRSMERYPLNAVLPILESVAASGSDEISRQAAESLKNMRSTGR